MRDCVRVSVEEKPGPVHLELPEDIAALPVAAGTHLFPPHPIRRPVPDDKAIDNAIALLKAAKRPLLCIAAGANRKRVQNMMSQFVDKLGLPPPTQMGKGVPPRAPPAAHRLHGALGERHRPRRRRARRPHPQHRPRRRRQAPFFAVPNDTVGKGVLPAATAAAPSPLHHHRERHRPCRRRARRPHPQHRRHHHHDHHLCRPSNPNAAQPVVLHISFVSAEVDSVYFPHAEVVGDIGNALWQIKEKCEPQGTGTTPSSSGARRCRRRRCTAACTRRRRSP